MSNRGWRNNGGSQRHQDSWHREDTWAPSNSYQKPIRETKVFVKKEVSAGNPEQITQPSKEENFKRFREETWVPKENYQRPQRETKIFVKKEEKAENFEQKAQQPQGPRISDKKEEKAENFEQKPQQPQRPQKFDKKEEKAANLEPTAQSQKEEDSKNAREEQKENSRPKNQHRGKKEVSREFPTRADKQEKKFVRKDENVPIKKDKESQPQKNGTQQNKQEKKAPKGQKNGNGDGNLENKQNIREKIIDKGNGNRNPPTQTQLTEQEQKEINDQFLLDEGRVAELSSLLFESAENLPPPPVVDSEDLSLNKPTDQKSLEESKTKKEKEIETPQQTPHLQKGKSGETRQSKPFNWVSKQFNQIYYDRRLFKNLYKQLVETWEEIHATTEDEEETFRFFLNTKPNYFLKYSIFVCLLFNLLIEKELFHSAMSWFEKKESFVTNEEQFRNLIFDVVDELGKPKHKGLLANSRKWKASTNFSNRVSLSFFGRKLDEVFIVDRFEKYNGSLLRVEAFEKIKRDEKIAIHFEINKYIQSYSSVLQIATKNEVFLFDIERLCRFDDNMQALVSFLTFIIGKKSSTVIVLNAKEFCDNLMNTLFIENEKKNQSFVEKKTEFCQTLDKYHRNLTDMSVFDMGTSIEELVSKVLNQQLDQRQKFGDWYQRPLTEKQIVYSAIDVCSLLKCYEELFEKKTAN